MPENQHDSTLSQRPFEELREALGQGDSNAWAQIIDEYSKLLHVLIHRRIGAMRAMGVAGLSTEEIFASFLKDAVRKIMGNMGEQPLFESQAKLRAYLCQIARVKCSNYRRRLQKLSNQVSLEMSGDDEGTFQPSAIDALSPEEHAELRELLTRVVDQLNEFYKPAENQEILSWLLNRENETCPESLRKRLKWSVSKFERMIDNIRLLFERELADS